MIPGKLPGGGINRLADVAVASASTGQLLVYNSTTGKWANSSIVTANTTFRRADDTVVVGIDCAVATDDKYATLKFLDTAVQKYGINYQQSTGDLYIWSYTDSEYVLQFDVSERDLKLIPSGGGCVGVGTSAFGANAVGVLTIKAGTHPTAEAADCSSFFVEDAGGAGTASPFAIDEEENEAELAPHVFKLFDPDPNAVYPWSFYGRNGLLGVEINVDMYGAIHALEEITGKQFIHTAEIPRKVEYEDWLALKREQFVVQWIEENTAEEEVPVENAVEERIVGGKGKRRYELVDGVVHEVHDRSTKPARRRVLKAGHRFDEETGKAYRLVTPTREAAEAAAKKEFRKDLPKWLKDRVKHG